MCIDSSHLSMFFNVFQMITLLIVVLSYTLCSAATNNNHNNIETLMDHSRCFNFALVSVYVLFVPLDLSSFSLPCSFF